MTKCANCGHTAADPFTFCPSCGTRVQEGQGGLIGSTLNDKYRILSELGQGSMGAVYLAEHVSLRKRIAIKILHRDLQLTEEGMQRFQREGIAAGQVTHPNAIQIFDFDRTADGQIYLAMEYVEGKNLKEVLGSESRLETDSAIDLTRQLLSALVEAHANGIVHRDVKPENLMVVEGASGERTLKVLDFGLSKLVDRPLGSSMMTQPGRVMGTPMYMAPEQWRGEDADARTDLHASATVLFEMLTGATPFQGKDVTEMLVKSTTEDAPAMVELAPDLDVPAGLEQVVHRGLARSRADRYQTASEMLHDLRHLEEQPAPTAPRRRAGSRSARVGANVQAAPNRTPLWIGGGAAVALAVAGAWWWSGGDGENGGASGSQPKLVRALPSDQLTADQRSYLRLLDSTTKAIQRGDPSTALDTVNDALSLPCADAEAYVVRAAVFRSRGDTESAVADLIDAAKQAPQYGLPLARRGWIQLDAGESADADASFQSALATSPACGEAYAGRAAVHLTANQPDQALDVLDGAPQDADAQPLRDLYRGRALLRKGQVADAIQALISAKRGDNTLWQAHQSLGDAYLAQDRPADAEREYREVLTIAPPRMAQPVRRQVAALLMERGATVAAQDVLGPRSNDPAGDGEIRLLRASLAVEDNDFALAQRLLREGLQLSLPEPALAHEMLGGIHLVQDEWAKAEEAFGLACELDDRRADAYFGWGMALFRLENYPRAAARFRKACELQPNHLAAQLNAGIVYRDYVGNGKAALAAFRAYQAAGGTDPRVPDWIRELAQ